MIELPPKFKQALGNGVRTSLYPLVRIYEGYRIDDTIPEDAESINLSIKETTIKNLNDTYENYNPLLLNSPSIKNSADIINNKYTISSVSLSISNAPFQGKIFSDSIQNLLNAVCEVYYCANGIDSIEDCLLVYTGTIRRFSQSAETIKLELEDLTEQILSTQIPSSVIPDDVTYKEEDIGKPYPMVYGFVDKSPLILKASPEPETGAVYEVISNLIIDKPNQQIAGSWGVDLKTLYENDDIENTILKTDNIITDEHYLFVYNNGFLPINRIMPSGWMFDYGADEPYTTNTLDGKVLYSVETDTTYGPNIKLSGEAQSIITQIEEFADAGIPTRIYRPIKKAGFFAKNKNTYLGDNVKIDDENKIYGFYNVDTSLWDPRDEFVKSYVVFQQEFIGYNVNDDSPAKDEYLRDWGLDNPMWWEPTDINELIPPEGDKILQWSYKDINWENNKGNGDFPVSYIQNGDENSGIHLTSQNYITNNSYPESGCFVKLILNQGPSFDCVTKVYYTVTYYQPQNIDLNPFTEGSPTNHIMLPSSLFLNPILESQQIDFSYTTLDQVIGNSKEGFIPYVDDENEGIQEKDTDDAIVNGSSVQVRGNQVSKLFNTTNAFDSIQWGINNTVFTTDLLLPRRIQSCVANLHEFYTVQDVLVNDIMNQEYFASVAGRADNGEPIKKSTKIIKDILDNELNFGTDIEDTDIDEGWIHSFTLNEQKEAKEVFEGLFKSSLIIPSFNPKGQFKLIPIHQVLNNVSYIRIDNQDLLKYSFSLTKLDDIKNQVNVKYKKNYGSGEFDKQTGYTLTDNLGNEYQTYDEVTEAIYQDPSNAYSIDYYGLTSEEAKLDVETEYIRDELTAKKLQKRLVSWYANQHLIAKIDLPVSYMNLEVGDYIKFNELVGGKLAFGYDYTQPQFKNGQVTYPVFFITKINKSLDKISIEAIQVNRGDYGSRVIVDEEDEIGGTIFDEGGNDGQANFDLADPNDDDSYGDDTIIDEDTEAGFEPDPFINAFWENGNNDLNDNPRVIIETNIEGDFDYEAFITFNNTELTDENDDVILGVVNEDDEPVSAGDYINFLSNDNSVQLFTAYELPEEESVLIGFIKIYYQGTEYFQDLDFIQEYVEPTTPTLGDWNGDGIVNILDVVGINVHIIIEGEGGGGIETWYDENSDDYSPQSDINGDGIVNVLDIVLLLNLILAGEG